LERKRAGLAFWVLPLPKPVWRKKWKKKPIKHSGKVNHFTKWSKKMGKEKGGKKLTPPLSENKKTQTHENTKKTRVKAAIRKGTKGVGGEGKKKG